MNDRIYYYTDFNTFKIMLQNGTLRFKESTSSNDRLDTIQLYDNLLKMAQRKYEETGISPEQKFYFDMLRHNGSRSSRVSLVACFTSKADSRLLWDAYTMHRKDRAAERYNGVCLEFNKNNLLRTMYEKAPTFDIKRCDKIIYGFDTIDRYLEEFLCVFSKEVEEMSKDKDQSQNIIPPIKIPFTRKEIVLKKNIVLPMLNLVDAFDTMAPFFKHSFWREENETRALLSAKVGSKVAKKLASYGDGSRYFDLPISLDCISRVILGPEFSESDAEELVSVSGRISFEALHKEHSEGTNIITNR